MKNFMLILIFFSASQLSIARQTETDSLLRLLPVTKYDSAKVDILYRLSDICDDDKDIMKYASQALSLAEKIGYRKGIADASNNIGYVYKNKGQWQTALDYYKRSLDIRKSINDQKGIAGSLNNIGLIEFRRGNTKTAIEYLLESVKIMEIINDSLQMGTVLNNIAMFYKDAGEISASLEFHQKSLLVRERMNDYEAISSSMANIALIYSEQGKKDSAFIILEKCLDIFEKTGFKKGIAVAYYGFGNAIGDPKRSIDYYFKSLAIYEEIGYKEEIAISLSKIGNAYSEMDRNREALKFHEKSLAINTEIQKKDGIATALNDIGRIYEEHGNLTGAINQYSRSLVLKKEIGQKQGIAQALNSLGNIYCRLKDYQKAERFSLEALEVSRALGYPGLISNASDVLSRVYAETGRYREAHGMHVLFKQMDDSVNFSEATKAVASLSAKFEFDKREALVRAAHEQKEAVSKKEIEKQKLVRNYTTGGFTLLLAGTGVFAFMFNQRRKSRFMHQVSEVEMKALRAQMNPHFIFNSLNSINRYMQAKDTGTASDYLTRFAKVMRMILENSQYPEVPLQDDLKALELYMQLEVLRMDNRFSYEVKVDDDIDPEITRVPPLILQPFVENAIWHGFSGKTDPGKIVIRAYKENNMLKCVVEDNGIGREKSAATKQPEKNKRSLGMKITRARIDIINQIKKSNAAVELVDLEQGMRVIVTLPFEQEY